MQRRSPSCARTRMTLLGCAAALVFTAVSASARADEFRGFWVDAWGAGFHSQEEVEKLLGRVGSSTIIGDIRRANCNAVVVQVRRRADVCYPSAMGEPYMSGLSPSNFNALQAMIDAAHDTTGGKQRIEVHCWIVVFKTRSTAPLYLNHNDPNDPENYWITRYSNGTEPDDKPLDPGHPRASEYLTDVCMDLVNNFDIDGLHYDYIRFSAYNEGYNPTSIARYNTRYGLTGQPSPTNEQFKQWRRDQITQYVRRVYAHVLRDKPQVKVSAAVVTWNPSPASSTRSAFMNTRPYYDVYSDWDAWMEEGILDISMPMTYYNQDVYPNDFLRWSNFQKDRKFNRHNVVGPGIYLNSLSNAIGQLQSTRNASALGNDADGFCGYSYRVPYSGGTWSGFEPSLIAQVTPSPDNIPDMPWKSTPTMGHLMGTVTYHDSGQWADGATVQITGPASRTMICDGTGFYAFIDLPPGGYTVSADAPGYPDTIVNVNITAGNMTEQDIALGASAGPIITNVQAGDLTDSSATITWNTDESASSQVEYGLTAGYGNLSPLDATPVTAHSVLLGGLNAGTLYHYRALSTNEGGTSASADATFATTGPTQITSVQIISVGATTATIQWQTTGPADSQVEYGLTTAYGFATPLDPALTMAHEVTLTGLDPETVYHCRVRSDTGTGVAYSGDLAFSTTAVLQEIVIDNLDPEWLNTSSGGGAWTTGTIAEVPKIGTDYLYATGVGNTSEAAATRACTWTPNLPIEGLWDVYVYYQIGPNRTSGAPYKVVYDGGELTSIENQNSSTPNQGGWFRIGEDLPFQAGTSGYVQLANNTADTAYVSADAARFVYKGLPPDTTPPTTPVVTDDGIYTHQLSELHAFWYTTDPESGIDRSEYRILELDGPVIRDWTSVGSAMEVTATELPLIIGRTYVFEVRAVNGAGLVSNVGASDGITVFPFDINGDGRLNGADLSAFVTCLSGAGVPYAEGAGVECGRFDTDADSDVDLVDYALFQRCLSGDNPIDLACLSP